MWVLLGHIPRVQLRSKAPLYQKPLLREDKTQATQPESQI